MRATTTNKTEKYCPPTERRQVSTHACSDCHMGMVPPHNTPHHTTQDNTTQHNTTQHSTTPHNTAHHTTQHNTTPHNTTAARHGTAPTLATSRPLSNSSPVHSGHTYPPCPPVPCKRVCARKKREREERRRGEKDRVSQEREIKNSRGFRTVHGYFRSQDPNPRHHNARAQ